MILEEIKNHLAAAERHLANAKIAQEAAAAAKRCADALIAGLEDGEKALLAEWQKKRVDDAGK